MSHRRFGPAKNAKTVIFKSKIYAQNALETNINTIMI
jgi:hypothetical protein